MTRVSVITINFNDGKGLERTIHSVLSQTRPAFEFIVIDGGSKDESLEVINRHRDKITHWISEKDSGIYDAQNKGIAKASGEYLLFMNSGDCFYDDTVLKKFEDFVAENP